MRWGVGSLPAAAVVGAQVAAGIAAIGRCDGQRIVAVEVARSASHGRVRIGQREPSGAVIEHARGPSRNRMATCALPGSGWEAGRNVIRNIPADGRGALECRRMAAVAIRGIQRIIITHVAGGACRRRRRHMRSSQRKAGGAVIKRRRRKAHGRVAIRAVGYGK